MIFGINKKKYNDPYNVLLAIATNIPVRLMTGFVIHILLFSNLISKYFISHIYHVYINTFYKWYIYNLTTGWVLPAMEWIRMLFIFMLFGGGSWRLYWFFMIS